jgi:hypothetical protein
VVVWKKAEIKWNTRRSRRKKALACANDRSSIATSSKTIIDLSDGNSLWAYLGFIRCKGLALALLSQDGSFQKRHQYFAKKQQSGVVKAAPKYRKVQWRPAARRSGFCFSLDA